MQDKRKEREFFRDHANSDAYDAFHPETNAMIIDLFEASCAPPPGGRVADLGCGSGVFTEIIRGRGHDCVGVDLSSELLELAVAENPAATVVAGDVESLPFDDATFDTVLLSGLVHHLPDPTRCARETARVLKPGGRFMAFDPNRMNPCMYLYRARSSPFYSSKGVTENERPVLAGAVRETFTAAGLNVDTQFLSGLKYRYVASSAGRMILPIYNWLDSFLFRLPPLSRFSAFVITTGSKPQP